MMTSNFPCPCQSNKSYAQCCLPFHLQQQIPATAEQLMRSRYSAYTQCNIDYIIATTLPSQQKGLDRQLLQQWAENTQWIGLQITAHNPKFGKNRSTVEFNAYFQTDTGVNTHHECSLFIKYNDRWYFVDPNVST